MKPAFKSSILHSLVLLLLITLISMVQGITPGPPPPPSFSIPSGYHPWYTHTYVLKQFKRLEYECTKPWFPSWFWWWVVDGFSKLELLGINKIKYPLNTTHNSPIVKNCSLTSWLAGYSEKKKWGVALDGSDYYTAMTTCEFCSPVHSRCVGECQAWCSALHEATTSWWTF
jgi:hypothetical protein